MGFYKPSLLTKSYCLLEFVRVWYVTHFMCFNLVCSSLSMWSLSIVTEIMTVSSACISSKYSIMWWQRVNITMSQRAGIDHRWVFTHLHCIHFCISSFDLFLNPLLRHFTKFFTSLSSHWLEVRLPHSTPATKNLIFVTIFVKGPFFDHSGRQQKRCAFQSVFRQGLATE